MLELIGGDVLHSLPVLQFYFKHGQLEKMHELITYLFDFEIQDRPRFVVLYYLLLYHLNQPKVDREVIYQIRGEFKECQSKKLAREVKFLFLIFEYGNKKKDQIKIKRNLKLFVLFNP